MYFLEIMRHVTEEATKPLGRRTQQHRKVGQGAVIFGLSLVRTMQIKKKVIMKKYL